MPPEIRALRDRMHECAANAGTAAQTGGKGSPRHLLQLAHFADAARAYEAACAAAGREPYATYSED